MQGLRGKLRQFHADTVRGGDIGEDRFRAAERRLHGHLLEIELTKEQDEILIPPFIKVIRDVTEEGGYSNKNLARIGKSLI